MGGFEEMERGPDSCGQEARASPLRAFRAVGGAENRAPAGSGGDGAARKGAGRAGDAAWKRVVLGIDPRTFHIHPTGRLLVAQYNLPVNVRDGDAVKTLAAGLSIFRIGDEAG
jgi:hypothetical protein